MAKKRRYDRICKECGTNLSQQKRQRKYMRDYMKKKRKDEAALRGL